MEFIYNVRITDAIMMYAMIIMAIFTVIIFVSLIYCAILIRRAIEGLRTYIKFISRQNNIMNKNIINLFPGTKEEKEKAKKELDVIAINALHEIETF